MDSEKLKQFIIPIALIILLLAGICYVAPKIVENYQSYTAAQAEIETKKTTVQEKQAKLIYLPVRHRIFWKPVRQKEVCIL